MLFEDRNLARTERNISDFEDENNDQDYEDDY